MKRLLSSFLVVLILMLTACGVPGAKPATSPEPVNSGNATSTSNPKGNNSKTLTIASNGGQIENMVRDVIGPKFKEKYGITVNYVAGLSSELIAKVELQKSAPQIDLVILDASVAVKASQSGLIDPIDPSSVPDLAKVDSRYLVKDTGVPVLGYSVAVGYNTKMFEQNGWKPITSWNDLIRPEYKGATALPDISSGSGFMMFYGLAMANGGSLDNLQPGIDKGKELASYSDTFYKNSTQVTAVMQQGGAVTVQASYTIADIKKSGIPIKMVIPKEGSFLASMIAIVVKNAPNKQNAIDFVNFLLTEETQKQVAEIAFYPVIKGMKLPEKYESVIGLKESDKVYTPDFVGIAKVQKDWTEKWSKEVNPELGKKVQK